MKSKTVIGENIRILRQRRRLTLEELGNAIGVSRQTVQRYESGMIANIPDDRVEALSRALGTTPWALHGWEDRTGAAYGALPVGRRRIPLLGEVACGKPIFAAEEHDVTVCAAEDLEADFCLRAKGDSMTGARIYDGDLVFIRAQDVVENGQIAVVVVEDEATLKRVYYYPAQKKLVLSPENPAYAPLVYVGSELESIHILGRAVAFQSMIR